MDEYDNWDDDPDLDGPYDYGDDDVGQSTAKLFYPILEAALIHSQGTNFTLLMEHKVDNPYNQEYFDHSIHPRYLQPCLGEMRKYRKTHPDECTQPKNDKPTDLWHTFPDGIPVAVGIGLGNRLDINNQMIREMFTKETSPWAAGIGSPEFVMKEGAITGVYMRDTKVDPTVLVNLFNVMKGLYYNAPAYNRLREAGASSFEAIALFLQMGSGNPLITIGRPDGYYTTERLSIRRILEAKPRDLSGGLYYDRVDYNRTSFENVFMNDSKPRFSIGDRLLKDGLAVKNSWGQLKYAEGVTEDDKIKALLSLIRELAASEAEPRPTMFDIAKQKTVYTDKIETKEAA